MLWLNPSILFALAVVAAPVLIHLLIHRRAERLAFPTLRFLQPTRLATIRRHVLEDFPLLAVRVALLAVVVAALAGPLLVTDARRQAWDRRIVRAIVADTTITGDVARPFQGRERRAESPAPHQEKTFQALALADGIRRAVLWLDAAPPARREIVVASPLPIGSLTDADVAIIPPDVGVRFERTGTLPEARTVSAGAVLTPGGVLARDVTFTRGDTSMRESATGDRIAFPIDVVAPATERPAVDAAIAAVLSQRVWAGPPDSRASVIVMPRQEVDAAKNPPSDVLPIQQPWVADAVSRIAHDPDLHAAGARVASGLSDARFSTGPWQILTSAADGRPLASAAASATGLIVVTAAPASDVALPVLLRAIANALAPSIDLQRAEVMPMSDAVLRRWSRPPMPVASPRVDRVDEDDRRWLWLAALCLMAAEMWIRRARPAAVARNRPEEDVRVA